MIEMLELTDTGGRDISVVLSSLSLLENYFPGLLRLHGGNLRNRLTITDKGGRGWGVSDPGSLPD